MMSQSKSSNVLAIGVSISLVIAAVFGGAYLLMVRGPKELAGATKDAAVEAANSGYDLFKRAANDFYQALQFEPKVTIGSATVHGPATGEAAIVTASKSFQHTYTYEATWAGSTKRLELKGDFTAKAGFPLDDSFSMDISEDGRTVTLRHKPADVISCEMTRVESLRDENGWWNKLEPQERESAQNELLRQARNAARESDLLGVASEKLVERLVPLQNRYSFQTKSEIVP
jgi:hypothetical protein